MWTGIAESDLEQGELLFSTLGAKAGATNANFEVAKRVDSIGTVPEASTILLIGFGLVGLVGFSRRKFK